MGANNRQWREASFWIGAFSLAAAIVALDRAVFFLYLPRWIVVLPSLVFLLPWRVNSTYRTRAAICAALIALPYAVAPVRWNLLKSFYLDCEALEPGVPFADALARMSAYDGSLPKWMAGAAMVDVRESTSERRKRVIIIPSAAHAADWCVLYPEGEQLARVEIHPD